MAIGENPAIKVLGRAASIQLEIILFRSRCGDSFLRFNASVKRLVVIRVVGPIGITLF